MNYCESLMFKHNVVMGCVYSSDGWGEVYKVPHFSLIDSRVETSDPVRHFTIFARKLRVADIFSL